MVQRNKTITAFEKHVQFELKSLRGEGLKRTIREEVTALFVLFDEVCLDDFTSAYLQKIKYLRKIDIAFH